MKTSGKTHLKFLKLLYKSFDSKISKKKQMKLDIALERFQDLRDEKERILSQRQFVRAHAERAFRPHFADRVMTHIAAIGDNQGTQESFHDALMFGFKRLAIVGTLVVVALLFFNIIQGHIIPIAEAFYASDLVMEEILNLPIF